MKQLQLQPKLLYQPMRLIAQDQFDSLLCPESIEQCMDRDVSFRDFLRPLFSGLSSSYTIEPFIPPVFSSISKVPASWNTRRSTPAALPLDNTFLISSLNRKLSSAAMAPTLLLIGSHGITRGKVIIDSKALLPHDNAL
uniref:Uncharacterized protein n=1 Tax=Spongospora subterranea TaxID=70186 RepID=A0A0H5QTK6_9EUKA|eukprot:CRZ04896.1 hypothetical protein [Spongospora subterranea]